MGSRFLRRIRRDSTGMATVEFALIAMPLVITIISVIEIGYRQYVTGMVQGTLQQMARRGSFEAAKTADLETFAKTNMQKFAAPEDVTLEAKSFLTFSHVGKPEKISKDVAPLGGAPGAGDCWIDQQKNGVYDANMSGSDGLGDAESVVRYTLNVKYKTLTPLAELIGLTSMTTITRMTMVRNEPFEGVEAPPEICIAV